MGVRRITQREMYSAPNPTRSKLTHLAAILARAAIGYGNADIMRRRNVDVDVFSALALWICRAAIG